MFNRRLPLLVALALAWAPGAWAQSTQRPQAITVPKCGTAPNSAYAAVGTHQWLVMDVNGNLCSGASAIAGVVTMTHTNGTVTIGGTFQTVLAANASRKSCVIQNNSVHIGSVFFGALADATAAKAILVQPNGGTIPCATASGGVTQQAVNYTTSTGADVWVAVEGQ